MRVVGLLITVFLAIDLFNIKPLRGSQYSPTPEICSNPKCCLINIKNEDEECFKWCMLYHQSNQSKNDTRTTALSKLVDKYNYDDVEFPASFEDIETFENNNKVCIFVYHLHKEL